MKYMLLFAGTEDYHDTFRTMSDEKRRQSLATVEKWWGEQAKAGRILEGHQLQAASTATTVRTQDGKSLVTDGPFIEAKETIGGFGVVEVPDLDAAIEIARTWPARGHRVEIRPIVPH